jgi:hypothetical protein
MVYSNRLYSAKAAFQSNKEPYDSGFYTTNKTASTIFCNTPSKCYRNKAPYLYNFEQLYALNKAVYLRQNKCRPSFNSNDLNILVSKNPKRLFQYPQSEIWSLSLSLSLRYGAEPNGESLSSN